MRSSSRLSREVLDFVGSYKKARNARLEPVISETRRWVQMGADGRLPMNFGRYRLQVRRTVRPLKSEWSWLNRSLFYLRLKLLILWSQSRFCAPFKVARHPPKSSFQCARGDYPNAD